MSWALTETISYRPCYSFNLDSLIVHSWLTHANLAPLMVDAQRASSSESKDSSIIRAELGVFVFTPRLDGVKWNISMSIHLFFFPCLLNFISSQFFLRHSSCLVKYISPLSTQSLTTLVCDKSDLFILPPPRLTLWGTSRFSSGKHFLNKKTYFYTETRLLWHWEVSAFPFPLYAQ